MTVSYLKGARDTNEIHAIQNVFRSTLIPDFLFKNTIHNHFFQWSHIPSRAETIREFAYQSTSKYFVHGLDGMFQELRGAKFLKEMLLRPAPAASPDQQKILVYYSVHDEISPIKRVGQLVGSHRCKRRSVVDFYRKHEGGRELAMQAGLPIVVDWLYEFDRCEFHDTAFGATAPLESPEQGSAFRSRWREDKAAAVGSEG